MPFIYDYILHSIFLKYFMKKTSPLFLLLASITMSTISISDLNAVESKQERLKKLKLPEAVTSFGACKDDNFLYVYGGHVGEAHVYSKETHSKSFVRINLNQPDQWEDLPFNQPLQGFGMAAYKGKVFISGGSQATNKEDSESNLSSLAKVSYFDVKSKKWIATTPLPQPRSSHEMVVHRDKLYVVGGWHMKDGKGVTWPNHGLVGKITKKGIKWEKLPKTNWTIRANSAAVVGDYVYVIGGLNNKGTSNAVHRLDTNSMKWEKVPDFPGTNRIKAFGSASAEISGKLLVSPFSYQPRIFEESNSTWVATEAKVKHKRFFHRVVPLNSYKALLIGGATWDGHLNSIEVLNFNAEIKALPKTSDKQKKSKSSNWGGFRGEGNSQTKETGLPLEWSDEKNLAWRVDLDGYGQSTPVVSGSNIYSTSTLGEESEKLIIHCHDLFSGSLQWKKIFESPVKIKRSQYVSQAAPSPVTDETGVYAFFESGLLIALDHDGEVLWKRSLTEEYGPILGNHGIGGSLTQSRDCIGLLVDHAGPSYLLSIHKKNGKNRWKVERPERVSWSSPTLVSKDDQEKLYISSNGVVECFDFKTGRKLWSKEGIEGNTVASPTISDDKVIVGSSKPNQTMALKRNQADEKVDSILWVAEDATCSFGSPLSTGNLLYLVNRAGVATCHDLEDGKKKWDLRLPGSCWASPLHAPGRVYFFTKEGSSVVLDDQGGKEILAQNDLTISGRIYGFAVLNRSMVLRTGAELICLRESSAN